MGKYQPSRTAWCCFTQGPMHNQMGVAKALGIPGHKVVARTKRIGGGFGGKETRAINLSCAAAVPAWHLRRAVRLIQDRDEDMHSSGHRHPFLGKYKARALTRHLGTYCAVPYNSWCCHNVAFLIGAGAGADTAWRP